MMLLALGYAVLMKYAGWLVFMLGCWLAWCFVAASRELLGRWRFARRELDNCAYQFKW